MIQVFATDFGVDRRVIERCITDNAAYCVAAYAWVNKPDKWDDIAWLMSIPQVKGVFVDWSIKWSWYSAHEFCAAIGEFLMSRKVEKDDAVCVTHDDLALPAASAFKGWLEEWKESKSVAIQFPNLQFWENFETIRIDIKGCDYPHAWVFKQGACTNIDQAFRPKGADCRLCPWPSRHYKYVYPWTRDLNDGARGWLKGEAKTAPFSPEMTWEDYRKLNPNAKDHP